MSNKNKFFKITTGAFLGAAVIAAVYYSLLKNESAKNRQKTPSFESPLPVKQDYSSPDYPAKIINLDSWKLTLPILSLGGANLLEIRQPQLEAYQMNPWFVLNQKKDGVVFRAPVNAPTTGNSSYPRSELREMTSDGSKAGFWSTKKGTHSLFLDEAITAVPKKKPEVVAGQIHGDDDDLLTVRLEYPKLFLARGKSDLYTLDENYSLGKRFSVKFMGENGEIRVYYNNGPVPVFVLEKEVNEAYFKAGVYTQSNCETEGSSDLCNENNYGEVVIYQLFVTHE